MQPQIEIIHKRTGKHVLVSANRAASLIRRGQYESLQPAKPAPKAKPNPVSKAKPKAARYDRKDMKAEED